MRDAPGHFGGGDGHRDLPKTGASGAGAAGAIGLALLLGGAARRRRPAEQD
ncbi:MAG: LPXTG cell wall anchor domain-containing protein [Sporichthyaceae bacterium]